MKTHKLIAMLLSLAMVIGLMTPAAMAEEEKVAKAGDEEYATLAEAISAAAPSSTVTLLRNASGSGVVIDKNITIDFGGYTYTFTEPAVGSNGTESNGFQILSGNEVALQDGTLKVDVDYAAKYYILVQNYADLTLTNMTLDGTNLDKWSKHEDQVTNGDSYVLSNNCGNVVINGVTNIIANDEGSKAYAFDVCQYGNYTPPVVTVNTSGTIEGNIEVTGGNLAIQKGSFTDLATAVTYAAEGATITLLEDVTLDNTSDSINVAGKTVTVDLNGKDVTAQGDAFVVTGTGHLILKDTVGTSDIKGGQAGVGSWTAVWAHHGGKVTIRGGSYCVGGDANTSDTTHQNDCIYAGSSVGLTAGTIIVEGGTFTNSDNTVWPLNMKDGSASSITVVGGTFDGWNPAEAYTEPAPARPTSFVPTGYYVKEVDGTYTVYNSNTIVGKTVTLDGDIIVPNGGIVVNADTTINLNGKTISAPSDTAGDGVFHVVAGGVLTINGEGTIDGVGNNNYSMAIWADGGEVVINGGTYTNVGAGADNHYDLIYAKNGGSVEINGGTFTCQTPFWTLNKNDKTNGTITVKGGTFTGYNPSVSNTENPTANFVAAGYVVEPSGENYVVAPCEYTVTFDANGGTVTPATATATHDVAIGTLPTPARDGYNFNGWFDAATDGNQVTTSTVFTGDITVYAQWTKIVSGGGSSSSSGGSSSSSSSTTTEKNPDGSTTTTKTDKTTGTVTETTKNPDGTTGVTKTDADGNVTEVSANVPAAAANAAAKKDEPVTLLVEVEAAESTEEAVEISVNVPKSGAKVEIPVENVTPGTVVIIVNADGTESVVPLTTLTENGVVVTLEDDATIKVVDNSKDFVDVPDGYALADSIDFVSARGLFEGTTETTFTPHANTTIAQTMTVLARLSGEDFYGAGSTTKGAEWATEKGLSDGTDVSKAITREQMVMMMWKLAGMPESNQVLTASDVNDISADALTAMQWAVEMGILKGNLDGTLNPNGNASRAHVAAFAERYVNVMAK